MSSTDGSAANPDLAAQRPLKGAGAEPSLPRDEWGRLTGRLEQRGLDSTASWPPADGWVCNCVVFRGERLLLLKRDPDGFLGGQWDLPGGKLDPGEQPAQAAARELREEAGLAAAAVTELAHYSNQDVQGDDFRFHTVTYLVEEADDHVPVRLSDEHPNFCWVTREEFDQLPVVWYIRRVLADADWGTMNNHHGESD
nr:NUDIX hydrolase [Corynebacterium lactis]